METGGLWPEDPLPMWIDSRIGPKGDLLTQKKEAARRSEAALCLGKACLPQWGDGDGRGELLNSRFGLSGTVVNIGAQVCTINKILLTNVCTTGWR